VKNLRVAKVDAENNLLYVRARCPVTQRFVFVRFSKNGKKVSDHADRDIKTGQQESRIGRSADEIFAYPYKEISSTRRVRTISRRFVRERTRPRPAPR